MTLFDFSAQALEDYNRNYMKEQLEEPDLPTFLYRAWPNSDGDTFYIEPYSILRRTPKGCWIDVSGIQRFVNLSWNKRWACPTRKEAVDSLFKRMQRWEKLLTRDLARSRSMQQTIAKLYSER